VGVQGGVALIAAALSFPAYAQTTFPSRPVTLIVPYASAGVTDNVTRAVARRLSERWGQQALVENRPGAGTAIGTAHVARAAGDGYTLLVTSFGFIANQIMVPNLPYSPQALTPLAMIGDAPGVLYVHPSVPAASVGEFANWMRAHKVPVSFASSGNGSSVHVMAELLAAAMGVAITHVPYKGNAPGLADLIGGQVQAMFDSPSAMPHARAGRLRALGVTSLARSALVPELPTIAESGERALADFAASSWFGVFVPATTPAALQARLHADFQAAMAQPGMREEILKTGIDPKPMSQVDFAAYLKNQLDTWGPVIRAKGITPT
jgi:tripartite-type tricarboxylate transporter receptor subunit TctC